MSCSGACTTCSNSVNHFVKVCDEEYCDLCKHQEDINEILLSSGMMVNILSARIRFVAEVDAPTQCLMDVILRNRSQQICGRMATHNVASFYRSEIECFEDKDAHVMQVDFDKIHDELESIEFLILFEKGNIPIMGSVAVIEDTQSKETICEFDLRRLGKTSDTPFSVATIRRIPNRPDCWHTTANLVAVKEMDPEASMLKQRCSLQEMIEQHESENRAAQDFYNIKDKKKDKDSGLFNVSNFPVAPISTLGTGEKITTPPKRPSDTSTIL